MAIQEYAVENMGLVNVRNANIDREFWADKRVLLTGHTGFKGAWLALWLKQLNAQLSGFSLSPPTSPNLHHLLNATPDLSDEIGDLRNEDVVAEVVRRSQPEIVIHMAAQALVRPSYADPVETFSTNVMGTVHLLNALRSVESVRSVLVVTSDKVYHNEGNNERFHESDALGGVDPYSASKGCQDIVAHSYRQSFLESRDVRLVTARAGNVIGGGDWAEDRLLTDVEASISRDEPVILRNPMATRPWQHVLEPLSGYLLYVQGLTKGEDLPIALNFGPQGSATVEVVVDKYLQAREATCGWELDDHANPHEAHTLNIDPGMAKQSLKWRPHLDLDTTIQWVADWHNAIASGVNAETITARQINKYEAIMSAELHNE